MHLPYQSPAIDRANRYDAALEAYVDPALFGISWDDVRSGIGSIARRAAPHAVSALNGLGHNLIDEFL